MSQPIPFTQVRIKSRFWDPIIQISRTESLPIIYEKLKSYGTWDAMRLTWKRGDHGLTPDILWDSDIGKYIEAASYALYHEANVQMEARVEDAIDMITKAQQGDGYIGIFHTIVEPSKRWTSLAHHLELYGGGHLLEAAVTRHIAAGCPKPDGFLGVMQNYVQLIKKMFGNKDGQLLDYPGHQEIELALMRLYDITGDESLVDLAKYFVEERGRTDAPRQGHAWDIAARKRGDDPHTFFPHYWPSPRCYWHMQAHLPIREQKEIVGHSVQAMYWLAAVTDIALATNEQSYLDTVDLLWQNMVEKKMYVTGGIGSVHVYEGFGEEYDLPNETSYAETCAAIGILFLAQRKLRVKVDATVADILELVLYNAMLAGISLDGKTFNYSNPLATTGCSHKRSSWFKVFCCPSNICRLLNSLGNYIYGLDKLSGCVMLTVHNYIGGQVDVCQSTWTVQTKWPWHGETQFTVSNPCQESTILRLRIPGWAGSYEVKLNGKLIPVNITDGYASLPARQYKSTDKVDFITPMNPERLEAHPLVHSNRNCFAIRRGPFIYALESVDQVAEISDLRLARLSESAKLEVFDMTILDKPIVGIKTIGSVVEKPGEPAANRKHNGRETKDKAVELRFIPYFAWGNRGPSDMRVWIAKSEQKVPCTLNTDKT